VSFFWKVSHFRMIFCLPSLVAFLLAGLLVADICRLAQIMMR